MAVGEGTDMINQQGDAYMDLGEVLLLSGKREEALAVLEYAVDRHERKGNLVSTGRAQERLAEISEARALTNVARVPFPRARAVPRRPGAGFWGPVWGWPYAARGSSLAPRTNTA